MSYVLLTAAAASRSPSAAQPRTTFPDFWRDLPEVDQRPLGGWMPRLLGELPQGHGDELLALLDLALGDRPVAEVLLRPERAARMRQRAPPPVHSAGATAAGPRSCGRPCATSPDGAPPQPRDSRRWARNSSRSERVRTPSASPAFVTTPPACCELGERGLDRLRRTRPSGTAGPSPRPRRPAASRGRGRSDRAASRSRIEPTNDDHRRSSPSRDDRRLRDVVLLQRVDRLADLVVRADRHERAASPPCLRRPAPPRRG